MDDAGGPTPRRQTSEEEACGGRRSVPVEGSKLTSPMMSLRLRMLAFQRGKKISTVANRDSRSELAALDAGADGVGKPDRRIGRAGRGGHREWSTCSTPVKASVTIATGPDGARPRPSPPPRVHPTPGWPSSGSDQEAPGRRD